MTYNSNNNYNNNKNMTNNNNNNNSSSSGSLAGQQGNKLSKCMGSCVELKSQLTESVILILFITLKI